MSSFWNILKIFTVVILVGCFVWNSFYIIDYFIQGKRVTSSNDVSKSKLKPPALFICREVAFTDPTVDMAKLEDFFDNTLDLGFSMYDPHDGWITTYGARNGSILDPNATDFKIDLVYSYSRGLCYTFKWLKEVILYTIQCVLVKVYRFIIRRMQ